MSALSLEAVHKRFGDRVALDGVSFEVGRGEVFGLLGPNGAGKTTIIRLALDILRADAGEVRLLDTPVREADHDRVAYLPEERGLYRREKLIDVLVYLARLKGMRAADAKARSMEWLAKLGLAEVATRRVEQLSKGMSQKAQIAAALVPDPELAILDEPFSGLDPVHVGQVIALIRERRERGRTTILATHRMDRVEELCDRMVLLNRGRRVLYGSVDAIRREHASPEVRVEVDGELPELPGVRSRRADGAATRLALEDGVDASALLSSMIEAGLRVRRFEPTQPSVEQIFVATISREEHVR